MAHRWCEYINGYGWPIDGVSTSMGMGGLYMVCSTSMGMGGL